LVESHLAAAQALESGIRAVPDARSAWAATQAAYRFFQNPRVELPRLIEPLIETGRQAITTACDHYALIIHDWSQLMYAEHAGKRDRVALSSRHVPEGYELQTALLVSDRNGSPLAPVVMSLRAADGVHCSRQWRIRPALSPLDELAPAMAFAEQQSFSRPLVHVIDAEADSVAHYREWSAAGRHFLVRADDRLVEYQGQERRCSAIREELREQGAFRQTRPVKYHGRSAQQWVAEVSIRLLRPGQRNRPLSEDRQRIPGAPLLLRLVISEVRSPDGKVLATWYLLTNVATDVEAGTLALWYYWRWSIESFFKLLKSAGMQVEQWQQETAAAIARRLLVACMACVTVWQLARSEHPQADPARRLLVRLSGRQMKRGTTFTMPALLAGMWTLLAMIEVLEHHSLDEIYAAAALVLPRAPPNSS
jgi:glycerophosphoryl diester phosphodiesterase